MLCTKKIKKVERNLPNVVEDGEEEETTLPGPKLGKDFKFPGLALLAIDYMVMSTGESGGKTLIRFSEKTRGTEKDSTELMPHHIDHVDGLKHAETLEDDAIFIKNIRYIDNEAFSPDRHGMRVYEAEKLTKEEAKEYFTETHEKAAPFFTIHGFTNEPGHVLPRVLNAQVLLDVDDPSEMTSVFVPVLWPNDGSVIAYGEDQTNAVTVALENIFESTDIFVNKNLLCHSMGNYLLRMGIREANKNKIYLKFDNIFLAAADVNISLFNDEYKRQYRENNTEKVEFNDGVLIANMLKDKDNEVNPTKGMLYCLYNPDDHALDLGSAKANWADRLGNNGIGWTETLTGKASRKVISELKDGNKYQNLRITTNEDDGDPMNHGYNFSEACIDHYRIKLGFEKPVNIKPDHKDGKYYIVSKKYPDRYLCLKGDFTWAQEVIPSSRRDICKVRIKQAEKGEGYTMHPVRKPKSSLFMFFKDGHEIELVTRSQLGEVSHIMELVKNETDDSYSIKGHNRKYLKMSYYNVTQTSQLDGDETSFWFYKV